MGNGEWEDEMRRYYFPLPTPHSHLGGSIRGDPNMKRQLLLITVALIVGMAIGFLANGQQPQMKKWQKGKGWGWVWGKDDEVGALNEMTDDSRLAALRLADR